MSKAVLIMGESGAGKTTSLRNLPPNEVLYIDADGKGLSWKGWRDQYNSKNKNYIKSSSYDLILKAMLSAKQSENIKYIVIDTINAVMLDYEMANLKVKGYDKWTDLADFAYSICRLASDLREDQVVIILGHAETITTEDGYRQTRLKTNGRKLEKIVLESKFTTVLLAKQTSSGYVFQTRGENTTAKTPLGMFDKDEIENDITLLIKELKEY